MKIIGLLMKEHVVIKRVVRLMQLVLDEMENTSKPDLTFIGFMIDFMRMYADKLHHGKEEHILFRELNKKELSAEHKAMLDELVKEHEMGRQCVEAIEYAANTYFSGDEEVITEVIKNFKFLIELYPAHIEKEDKEFFIPAMNYFSDEEKEALFDEGAAFDKELALKDYIKKIEEFEKILL